ncbi:MAG: carbon-nitrogen family hydrolase [Candidatus Gastranaerophilales bacterium]|nr:carbon-nitrogen family hydrolase [Candidatus Gastranaerophilales bacterium]
MGQNVKILGIQLSPTMGDKIANMTKIASFLKNNADFMPDIVLLPEFFNTGLNPTKFEDYSEAIPAETTMFLAGMAETYKTNIIGTFIEKCPDGKLRNTCLVIDRTGKIVAKYHKIHLFSNCEINEDKFLESGKEIVAVQLDCAKIGLSICYDLRFPELYRNLVNENVQIITCLAAWPSQRVEHWTTLSKARAIENQCFFIAINQVGKTYGTTNAGNSAVISPWGEILASAGDEEGILKAEIDLNLIKKIRADFPVLKDRKIK